MFPGAMNTANIKKVSELWEEEKKYRWWIIGFATSLIVLFVLNLVFVVMAYMSEKELINYFMGFYPTNREEMADNWFNSIIVNLIIWTVALFISSLVFIYSIFNCYKAKSFEKLDSISSFFVGFLTFYSFFSNFFNLIRISEIFFGNNFMIFYFFLPFLSIPVWLLLARQVRKIKRSFFIAKRQEEINAFYEANQGQMGTNPFQSPFGFPFQRTKTQEQQFNPVQNPENDAEIQKNKEKSSKLEAMTIVQLRQIADKLSISGIKEMKKAELIKTILSVTDSFGTDSNDQIDIDPDNNIEIEIEENQKNK
ncbi:MAG: Rho termination factor N-terminal domain-containing protein [Metamycoplasmataceae bacterium]